MAEPTNAEVIHKLKNHLAVIVGFCDLLLSDCAPDDQRRADLLEVNKAAREALALMPDVVSRMRK